MSKTIMSKTIREQYDVISKDMKYAEELLATHKHKLFKLQKIECEHPNMEDDHGSGRCPDCEYRTEEWFCPTSPNKECEYYDSEADSYNEDCCIYCGNPEERK